MQNINKWPLEHWHIELCSKCSLKCPRCSRQEVPEVYEINTIVWIYSRNAILKIKKRIPKKTIIFQTPLERSIDIDNENDIKLINYYQPPLVPG